MSNTTIMTSIDKNKTKKKYFGVIHENSGLYNLYLFMGKVPICFAFLGFSISLTLGFMELLVALNLQLFLYHLGVIKEKVNISYLPYQPQNISNVLVMLFSVLLMRFLMQVMQSQSMAYAAERISFRLKSLVVYDFLYSVSSAKSTSVDIYHRFSEIIPKAVSALNVSIQIISTFIQIFTFIGIMFSTLYAETLISIVGILLIGLMSIFLSSSLKSVANSVNNESFGLLTNIQRASRNLLFFKLMRIVNLERLKLSNSLYILSSLVMRSSFITATVSGLPSMLGGLLLISVLYIGHTYFHSNGPALVTFLYLLVRFVQSISTLTIQYANFQSNKPQFEKGFQYFKNFPKSDLKEGMLKEEALDFLGHAAPKSLFSESLTINKDAVFNIDTEVLPNISLKNLTHRYPDFPKDTFSNLNLFLNKGEHLGIVGQSGSGKSTLLMVIMGIIKPASGIITISGLNPSDYFSNKSNRIGYVGVEPYLVKGSIKENLLYGISHQVSDEEINSALSLAKLYDFYYSVGEDHQIDEDQSGMSAGQKQRLCIARAILNKPQILVLDEATANLDKKTESEIAEDLKLLKGRCTVLIVSHQEGMLRYVDKVLRL